MAPQPRRGGGGGGVDVHVGGGSSGGTTNRCAEADAFQNPVQLARLVVNAIFCLGFMVLFWMSWKTPKRLEKKALAKVKDEKFKLNKKNLLPYWWFYNFALFIMVVVFILRIVSLCLVECEIFYIEKITYEPTDLTKAAFPLFQISILLIMFFVSFFSPKIVHKRVNKASGLVSKATRAFFFVLYVICTIVFVSIYMYYYVDYRKETRAVSFAEGDAIRDKFFKLLDHGLKISFASDVFALGLAIATTASLYGAVRNVHNMVYKKWAIILGVAFTIHTLYTFIIDAMGLDPNFRTTVAGGIAVSVLTNLFILAVFACALFLHTSIAKLEVDAQIANHTGSPPPAGVPQNQYQANPNGAHYPPQQAPPVGYFPQQSVPHVHQGAPPDGVQQYPSPPPNQQYPSPPPNMQHYSPTPPPNMQQYPVPMQGSPPPQGQYHQQTHGYYVPQPQHRGDTSI